MRFLAKIEELQVMLDWICSHLTQMQFDRKTRREVELASEEALVNIIRYAYSGRPEEIEIEVKVFPKSYVEIAIQDRGPPFNPLQSKKPDFSASLEEKEVGGLGIYLMRQYMDEVRYQRKGDRNLLILIKKCRTTHSSQTK